MDIRSFFSAGNRPKSSSSSDEKGKKEQKVKEKSKKQQEEKNTLKKKSDKKRSLGSDSDEEPLPKKLRKTNSSKRTIIKDSDEEDDIIITNVKRSERETVSSESSKSNRGKKKEESIRKSPAKPKMKPISADNYFCATPIVQKMKPTLLGKRKVESTEVKLDASNRDDFDCEDIILDDDDDFEKTIKELDSAPCEPPRGKKNTEKKSSKFLEESPLPTKEKPKKSQETSTKKIAAVTKKISSPVKTPPSAKKIAKAEHSEKEDNQNGSTPSLERRKSSYASYRARDGPKALGSKELPQGADNCLEGFTFVLTGILESIEREQASDLVKRHGGKITASLSKKTSYVVVGRDAGESKLEKAGKFGTKQLDEDGLFDLIRQQPGKKSKYEVHKTPEKVKDTHKSPSTTTTSESKYFQEDPIGTAKPAAFGTKKELVSPPQSSQHKDGSQPMSSSLSDTKTGEVLLWVDKYKPKVMKNIVGQQGDKSNAKKLLRWLVNWNDNHLGAAKSKGKAGYFSGKEDGSIYKCALLSGSPGIGKTTTATLVCQEAGFSFFEMNASDARSKKTLQQVIAEVLSNNTVDGILQGKKEVTGRHALIMDEVDGMAGNEDRGGIQELIYLIKNTKIPIICMCNDRNHQKIRSLANHCFDLRFSKPRVEQIKAFAMSLAFKEGLKIPTPVMEQIVIGANHDIRQVLHNLQMWTSTKKSLSFDEAKQEAKSAEKDIKMGSFDIVRKLFNATEAEKMSIQDKTNLFFNDYSFVPLFVQENYLNSNPSQSRGNMRKTLELTSEAADAIADSNLVDKLIRSSQNWSLLPLQGFYSCVAAPGKMRGGLGQKIEFPQWLGKNSSQGKHDRILQELKMHMRLSCLANKSDLNMDYLWVLRKSLVSPLQNPGDDVGEATKNVINILDSYNLTREDWDSLMDIGKWGSEPDVTASIPSKVKAAFTRAYNKGIHMTPYAAQNTSKKSKGATNMETEITEGEEAVKQSEDEEEEDITKDSMIKVKKGPTAKKGPAKGKGGKTKTEPKKADKGKAVKR